MILDNQRKIYELFDIKVMFKPFEIHFINLYSNTMILLHNWVLHFSRIPMICYFQFLDLQKIFYAFYKFWHNLNRFESVLKCFDSGQATWRVLIRRYQFGWIVSVSR
jgi:hypothetical protein